MTSIWTNYKLAKILFFCLHSGGGYTTRQSIVVPWWGYLSGNTKPLKLPGFRLTFLIATDVPKRFYHCKRSKQ